MTTIAIIGAGWRAEFYIRIAQLMPERFEIIGVVARKEEVRISLEQEFGVRTFSTLSQLLSYKKPDYAVSSVSWDSNPGVVEELVKAGVHVLCASPMTFVPCSLSASAIVDNSKASSITSKTRSLITQSYA